MTSRAPSLPVNHYMGRAVSLGFLACFAASRVYYWSRGLGWCLDCTLIGGPLAAAQPSLDTGVRTLLGNWTIYVVSTLRPKPLRGPGAEHPTAPPGESAERKLGPRKPRPREGILRVGETKADESQPSSSGPLLRVQTLGPAWASCSEILSLVVSPSSSSICQHRS